MDIATSLNNLAYAILETITYQKVVPIDPFNVTPPVLRTSLTAVVGPSAFNVSYITVLVRSMGTATYVGISTASSNTSRLTGVGDSFEIRAPDRCYIDASKIMINADVADAVVEVSGLLIPVHARRKE